MENCRRNNWIAVLGGCTVIIMNALLGCSAETRPAEFISVEIISSDSPDGIKSADPVILKDLLQLFPQIRDSEPGYRADKTKATIGLVFLDKDGKRTEIAVFDNEWWSNNRGEWQGKKGLLERLRAIEKQVKAAK